MASNRGPTPPLPVLTQDGVKKLIDRLNSDLAAVESSAASADVKKQIRELIAGKPGSPGIRKVLELGALNDAAENVASWVVLLAKPFRQLTALLQSTGLSALSPSGACFYQGGCIQTTQAQCADLHGSFQAGVDCP